MFGIEAISQDLILNVIALILNSSKVNIYQDHCTSFKDFTGTVKHKHLVLLI